MVYNIIGLKNQMNIIGNFLYINDNIEENVFPKFNIIYINEETDLEILKDNIKNDNNISLLPNIYDDFCLNSKEVFDKFDLPYFFASNKELESYYF